jgi:hypothetical protein
VASNDREESQDSVNVSEQHVSSCGTADVNCSCRHGEQYGNQLLTKSLVKRLRLCIADAIQSLLSG